MIVSFDTSLLVYAADVEAGERHARAADLLERAIRRGSCVQTLQSFSEFFSVLTRKLKIAPRQTELFVQGWMAVLPVEPMAQSDLVHAMRAVQEHKLAFWDALLWATARRIGVGLLFSEDLQDGRVLESVRVVDPFTARNASLIEAELPAAS